MNMLMNIRAQTTVKAAVSHCRRHGGSSLAITTTTTDVLLLQLLRIAIWLGGLRFAGGGPKQRMIRLALLGVCTSAASGN